MDASLRKIINKYFLYNPPKDEMVIGKINLKMFEKEIEEWCQFRMLLAVKKHIEGEE